MIQDHVTVIIVTHQSEAVIRTCLMPLQDLKHVIVVDNASKDRTEDYVTAALPQVDYVKLPVNIGFGSANNAALHKVKTPYALLLNPDAVISEEAIQALVDAARTYPDAAILAPTLYDGKGKQQESYKKSLFDRTTKAPFQPPEGDVCAGFLSGAVWLLNMELMRKVHFFDPDIFMYYEDDDLCMRVRKAGYGAVLVSAAKATHISGHSSPVTWRYTYRKHRHMAWSRLYIEYKYQGAEKSAHLRRKLLAVYALKSIGYLLMGRLTKCVRSIARLHGTFSGRIASANKVRA